MKHITLGITLLLFAVVTIFNLTQINYSQLFYKENFAPMLSAIASLIGLVLVWVIFMSATIEQRLANKDSEK